MNRNRLYLYVSIACVAGYAWLFYSFANAGNSHSGAMETCLLKRITGLPCPSCGSTRAIISLLQGDLLVSVQMNPLGIVIACIMLAAPLWIVCDIVARKKTLLLCYRNMEVLLRTRTIAISCLLLVAGNWIWNITKGL